MSKTPYPIAGPIDHMPEKRFSVGPTDEVVLEWWDHTVTCSVWREHSEHRVVVCEDVDVRWSWHVGISAACAVLVVIIALFSGLSFLYSLMMGVLLGLIVMGLIMYERTISADRLDSIYRDATKIDGETMLLMDEPVWEDIKAVVKEAYDNGLKDACEKNTKVPKWLLKLRPMPARVMDVVLRELHAQLDPDTLRDYHGVLEAHYRESEEAARKVGRGVRGCICRACTVRRVEGWEDGNVIDGSAAGAQRKKYRVAIGDGAVVDRGISEQRKKAQKRVAEYNMQREKQRLAEIEAERKRKAREFAAEKMGKNKKKKKRVKKAEKPAQKTAVQKDTAQ